MWWQLNNECTYVECECSEDGSNDQNCDDTGNCSCKDNVGGMKCDVCNENTYGYPNCKGMATVISEMVWLLT